MKTKTQQLKTEKQQQKELLNNFLLIQKSENYKQAIKTVIDEKLAFKK